MLLNKIKIFLLLAFITATHIAIAQKDGNIYDINLDSLMNLTTSRTSVLGLPHTLNKDEFELKYSYTKMEMFRTYDGKDEINVYNVLNQDVIAPNYLIDKTHKFDFIYGLTDDLALNVSGGFKNFELGSSLKYSTLLRLANVNDTALWVAADKTRFLGDFIVESAGFTDTDISLFINFYTQGEHTALMNLGVTLPTGSITETFKPPVQDTILRAPYPLQFGSGTYDRKLSLTYLNSSINWSSGIDFGTIQRFEKNSENYRKGNEYWVKFGGAYNLDKLITVSIKLDYLKWNNYAGFDEHIEKFAYLWHIGRTDTRGGSRLNGSIGMSVDLPKGLLKGHRITIDYRTPLHQDLKGPQLNEASRIVFTWSNVFGKQSLF